MNNYSRNTSTEDYLSEEIYNYGLDLMSINDLNSTKSVYQYTFNNKVAGCKSSQSFVGLLREELSRRNLNEKTTNFSDLSKDEELDFNKVWSRENYENCNETFYANSKPTDAYPILNDHFSVDAALLESERENINSRIWNSIQAGYQTSVGWVEIPEKYNWTEHHSNQTKNVNPQLLCAEKWTENMDPLQCQNKFIFTKEGRFVVTAILLDPFATACELRVSFIVKVKSLATVDGHNSWHKEFVLMSVVTASMLLILVAFFFAEPLLQNLYVTSRKTVAALSTSRMPGRFSRSRFSRTK